jgi:endoglycosylceramidase
MAKRNITPAPVVFLVASLLLVFGGGEAWPQESMLAEELPHLRVESGRIVDRNGGAVILRGVAVNQLGDYFQANPEIPATLPLTSRDFEQMAALGLNSVRLVVSWSLLEPRPGLHDPAYLARIQEAVGWARANGIYVVLDMHQDAWGKYIASDPAGKCRWPLAPNIGWDGAPEWATLTIGKDRCKLVQRELSPAVFEAWQSFWQDREGIQQNLVDTWAWLAAAFKHDPVVAGYDLLNEPNWGYNMISAVNKYKPAFYRRAVEAIRRAETGGMNKIVFFEPLAVWSALPGEKAVAFTADKDIVYSPHIYLGSISVDMFFFHRELIPLRRGFDLAGKEAGRFHTTFYNGEWMPGPGDHGFRFAALEDQYQAGSARWIWKTSCGDPHRKAAFWPEQDRSPEGLLHSVVTIRCGDPSRPQGVEEGINPLDALILGRPYPRSFPRPALFSSDPKARSLEMSGTADSGDVPLLVWVPGAAEPVIECENIGKLELRRVDGGYLLHGLPGPGAWRLKARGRE